MLQVAQPEYSSDEQGHEVPPSVEIGEEFECSGGAKSQDSESSRPANKKSKKKVPKSDLAEVLAELLSDSRKELRQAQAAVEVL